MWRSEFCEDRRIDFKGGYRCLVPSAPVYRSAFHYLSRAVNLATLAPDIVAAILHDALTNRITPVDVAADPPALWDEQCERIRLGGGDATSAQHTLKILKQQEQMIRIGRTGLELP